MLVVLASGSLLTSGVVLGVASPASAAGTYQLVITTQPSSTAQSGVALATQPVVHIENAGVVVTSINTGTVTASTTSTGCTVTHGAASGTITSGVATFSGLTVTGATGASCVITFTDTTDASAPVTSTAITLSEGVASKLVVTVQPSPTEVSGVALATQPVVKVEDSFGNVVTSINTGSVVASTTSTGCTVANAGATSGPITSGVATFSGLTMSAALGTSCTLTFTNGSLPTVNSSAVTITGAATHLVIVTQPASSALSGTALSSQPVVKVEDAAGNVVTDSSVVTAAITSGGVSVTNGVKTSVGGVATFTGLTLNALVGTYTLTFTDGTLTAAVSTGVTVGVGPATQLVITTEPSTVASSGVALATQPAVTVHDSGGNVVTSVNSGLATAAISVGTGGTISAGTTAPFVLGKATFSGLTITGTSGVAYGLVYTGAALSVADTGRITMGALQSPLYIITVKGWHGRNLRLATRGGTGTGAVTYAVVAGTAQGCRMSGAVLFYSSTGTCIVTATKAASGNYQPVSSAPTKISIVKLPIPHLVIVQFNRFSNVLSPRAHHDLILLARHLTPASVVRVVGYAPGNARLARLRSVATLNFLRARVRAHFNVVLQTRTGLQQARVITVAQ